MFEFTVTYRSALGTKDRHVINVVASNIRDAIYAAIEETSGTKYYEACYLDEIIKIEKIEDQQL